MISDISSAVAQGANAIDGHPGLRRAGAAGDPGGDQGRRQGRAVGCRPGREQRHGLRRYVDWNAGVRRHDLGAVDGQGAARQGQRHLHSAARPATRSAPASSRAIVKVFAKYPGIQLLTGNTGLAGHQLGSGDGAEGHGGAARASTRRSTASSPTTAPTRSRARRAFQAAGRKLVPIADARRERALLPLQAKKGVPLATISSRNWLGRIAARKAIAAAEGLPNQEPSLINLPLVRGHAGRASRTSASRRLPSDFYPPTSSRLAQIDAVRDSRRSLDVVCPRRSPPHGRRQDVPGRRRAQGRLVRGASRARSTPSSARTARASRR